MTVSPANLQSPAEDPATAHYLLLSGGVDSSTLAGWVQHSHRGAPIVAITFMYGQKHGVECDAASAVAAHYGLEHRVVGLSAIEGSALTDDHQAVPEGRDLATVTGVAPTYVPARNLLFLATLASIADAHGPADLWLGVHRDDHTGYPDTRPEFVRAADEAVRLGTQYGLRVKAPFVEWSKADVVRWGVGHEVPYDLTLSCYQGSRPGCGVCDTCQARIEAFREAGAVDPIPYKVEG